MKSYSSQEKFSIVHLFLKNNESYITACRKYANQHGRDSSFPSFNSIKLWLSNLFEHGSVEGNRKKKKSKKLEETKIDAKEIVSKVPRTSIRRISAISGKARSTVWRALKAMKFYPYRMRSVQHLEKHDHGTRRQFCLDELERITKNPSHLQNLIFSDEAHFHLDGGVNRHNCRMWSVDNPRWLEELPLHSPRVTVWGAMSHFKVYGPYFFEGNVSGESYLDLLKSLVLPEIVNGHSSDELIFMQDGAPPHYSKKVREWLESNLKDRWMGRGSKNLTWPPRSPDLTPMDFFFWGYVKSLVYSVKSDNLEELKERIREAFEKVNNDKEVLQKSLLNYEKRLKKCLNQDGCHFEHHF